MSLTPLEIKKIADLSGIELCDQQISDLKKHFDRLLVLVDQMQATDASDIETLDHPVSLERVHKIFLRDDIEKDEVNLRITKTNAPEMEKSLFRVPKIIE